jgi:hypothetical protein
LRGELANKVSGYRVRPREGWLKIAGKKVIPVDIMMESHDRLVLIEIESHRQDPSNNIAKIPFWLKHDPVDNEVVIIQLFSPFYDKHRVKKKVSEELGKLIMEKFEGKVRYESMSFSPEFGFEQFEEVYLEPDDNRHRMNTLIQKTAERIIKLLSS